jgi:hypothetical protein
MPTRFLTDGELAQLSGFPAGIAGGDLITYFRWSPATGAGWWPGTGDRPAAWAWPCSCAPCRGLASCRMT